MPLSKRRLAELTAGKVRQLVPRRPAILRPLGRHEDQGPHALMGDDFSAQAVAISASRNAGAETSAT